MISGEWSAFFSAQAGASAALAGLVFVAVSINLSRILEFPQLPVRVMEALITLLLVLVVATFGLMPAQPALALGFEVGGAGLVVWVAKTLALVRTRAWVRHHQPVLRVLTNQLPPLLFVAAGAWLAAGSSGGMYWIVPATLLSYVGGLFDTWVLLIEIRR